MVSTAAAVRGGRYVALGLMLLATDIATKLVLRSPGWQMHMRAQGWELRGALLLVALLALTYVRCLRAPMVVLAAGAAGNLLSGLSGAVPNPFTASFGHIGLAFNVADVLILVGLLLTLAGIPRLAHRLAGAHHPPRQVAVLVDRR